jgi:1-acyl-sn-glycerol-3-phosphate acyltransferase
MADWCLRIFAVLDLARHAGTERDSAFHVVTIAFIAPFILLAPINGALANGLQKRWVLVGSAGFCLLVTASFGLAGTGWLWCVALASVGAAIYSPTRYALLPAVAQELRSPLSRINAWIEMGGATATVAGVAVAQSLAGEVWQGVPAAVAVAIGLNFLATLCALPAWFAFDVRRPEAASAAIADFFRDCRRILADGYSRTPVLGLACFMAVLTVGTGAIVAYIFRPDSVAGSASDRTASNDLTLGILMVGFGAAAGSLCAGIQRNPHRVLGFVPVGASGLVIALLLAMVMNHVTWPALLLGFMGGLTNVPLRAVYQGSVPADARGNGMAVSNTANYVCISLLSLLVVVLIRLGVLMPPLGQLWFIAVVAVLGAVISWRYLLRETLEIILEVLIWHCYRFHVHGPLDRFPSRGPVIVYANHAAWLDPIWLSKPTPRLTTPMMTSVFYDLPVLRWLLKYVAYTIRVEAKAFRREAPELREAVAALDRGACLLIFPEGRMRRREDQLLHQFGQGIWHILADRPQTPVVPCWIEGNWGSYFSYRGGLPTKNKRLDWRRPIDIVFGEPTVLDPAVLADHRSTRTHLMEVCLALRQELGLEKVELAPVAQGDEEA